MRQAMVVALGVALMLVLAGTAAANKPDKFPTPFGPASFDAGDLCPFAASWAPGANGGFAIVHTKRDGSAYLWGGGHNTTVLTNLDHPEKTVEVNTTGPGKLTFNDDGSIDIDGGGHWLVGITAEDPAAATAGPSLTLYSGHIHIHQDLVNGTQITSYNGTAPIDACALIG